MLCRILGCNDQPPHGPVQVISSRQLFRLITEVTCFSLLSIPFQQMMVGKILTAKFSVINVVLTRFHRTIIHEFDRSITLCIDLGLTETFIYNRTTL